MEWFQGHQRSVVLAAIGLQLLVLPAMVGMRCYIHSAGETVLLRVVPIDPRDLMRGEYLALGYEFSRVPAAGIEGLPARSASRHDGLGRTVYVTLVPEADGKHYRAGEYRVTRPARGPFIRGMVTSPGRLTFGIESYFVQEGKGRAYEDALRTGQLAAFMTVTPDGQAALRGLRIEPDR